VSRRRGEGEDCWSIAGAAEFYDFFVGHQTRDIARLGLSNALLALSFTILLSFTIV